MRENCIGIVHVILSAPRDAAASFIILVAIIACYAAIVNKLITARIVVVKVYGSTCAATLQIIMMTAEHIRVVRSLMSVFKVALLMRVLLIVSGPVDIVHAIMAAFHVVDIAVVICHFI